MSYQDAAERVWQFTIRHAEIATHEDRQYLDCWCEETTGNQDLPELMHNWCLRLDRILDAAVVPISGQWHPVLDTILVELHLFRGLAFAYHSKSTLDQGNEWLIDSPQIRRFVRQVSSTFWFTREVLRYGKDCEVIAPDLLRQKIKQEIVDLYNQYNDAP